MANQQHNLITGTDLHAVERQHNGNPNGSLSGIVGQYCQDTNSKDVYRSTGGTSWEKIIDFSSQQDIPAGSNTQVQYNDAGELGGATGLTYTKATSTTTATNLSVTGNTTIGNAPSDSFIAKAKVLEIADGITQEADRASIILTTYSDSAISDADITLIAPVTGDDRTITLPDATGTLAYFTSAGTNNQVITSTGNQGLVSETNLTFDGSTLAVTGAITANTLNTGHGANELYPMDQAVRTIDSPSFVALTLTQSSGTAPMTITSTTVVTNLNADLWDNYQFADYLNQPVRTTDAVTFATVNTGQGNNELYAMDQNVRTTDAVTFATVNTGHGANELYPMNQAVRTTDSPSFYGLTVGQGTVGSKSSEINLKTYDNNDLTTVNFILKSPDNASTISADRTLTLPDADGILAYWASGNTNNRVLTSDGASGLVGEANLTFDGTILSAPRLTLTQASGTAPMTITSTTVVTNLNADLLDGQHGSYYLDYANFTGTPPVAGAAGSDGQVQYNNSGSLGGASSLYYDDVNGRLGIGTASSNPASLLDLTANNTGITTGDPLNTLRFTDNDTTSAAGQPMGRIEWYSADASGAGVKAYIQAQATDGSPDADMIFATNHITGGGTLERMRILYNGNVGIGVTPSEKLHVQGKVRSANAGNTVYSELQNDGVYATGTDLYLFAPSGKFLSMYAGASERMRIDSNGTVTLSGTTPILKIDGSTSSTILLYSPSDYHVNIDARDVSGTARLHKYNWTGSSYQPYYENWWDGDSYHSIGIESNIWRLSNTLKITGDLTLNKSSAGTPQYIYNENGGSDLILYTNSGRVTIDDDFTVNQGAVFNEDGGNYDFRVEGDTDQNLLFVDASTDRVGIGTASPDDKLHVAGNLFIEGSSPEITLETGATHYNWQIAAQENVDAALEFSVGSQDADASNDTFSPLMVIKNNGNVGIGTVSPTSYTDGTTLEIKGKTGTGAGLLKVTNANGIVSGALYAGSSGLVLNTQTNHDLSFNTNNSPRMTIDSSGYVGIGGTPTHKLYVRNDVSATVDLDPTSIKLYNNSDGGSAIEFSNAVGGNSKISFGVESTGAGTDESYIGFSTSANAASATERMRIASDGDVKIGSGSPASGYKLDVDGSQLIRGDIKLNKSSAGTAHYIYNENGGSDLVLYTNSGKVTVDDDFYVSGNAGIGVASPNARIHSVNNNFTTSQGFLFEGYKSTYGATSPVVYIKGNWEYNTSRSTDPILKVAAYNDPNGFYVLHSGYVGIGTTSPSAKLHVVGSSIIANNTSIDPDSYVNTVVAGAIADGSGWGLTSAIGGNAGTGDTWALGHNGSGLYFGMGNGVSANTMQTYMQFATNRNLYLVPTSGNVGIGTTSPTQHISGTEKVLHIQNSNVASLNLDSTNGRTYTLYSSAAGTFAIYDVDGSAARLLINSSGNLGIGASPSSKLEVSDSSSSTAIRVTTTAGTGNRYSQLQFMDGTTQGMQMYQNHNGGTLIIRNNTSTGDIAFLTNDTNTRMTITSNGYLRMASGTGGIQFGGDTAAANALDDYEEGNWSPEYSSTDFDTLNMGTVIAKYTKVGRMVTISAYMETDGLVRFGSAADVIITGLPFTPISGDYYACSIGYANNWAGDDPIDAFIGNGSRIELFYRTAVNGSSVKLQSTDMGTGVNANVLIISATYYTS